MDNGNLLQCYLVFLTIVTVSATSATKFFHEPSMITLRPPQNLTEDAFFGYSVTYVYSSKRLIVGAPNSDNIGKIFQCNISSKNCSEVPTLLTEETKQVNDSRLWNGAAVQAARSFFVGCAPRSNNYREQQKQWVSTGKCFTYDGNGAHPKNLYKNKPYDLQLGIHKWSYLVFLTIVTVSATSATKVFHEPSMITLRPPQNLTENAFFGYSVTYVYSSKRLIVGAPNSDNIGKIFQCNVSSKNCSEVPTLLTEETKQVNDSRLWNGAAVQAARSFFVGCAPRSNNYREQQKQWVSTGKCFTYDDNGAHPKNLYKNKPYDLQLGIHKWTEEADPFGWSISIAENDSVLVGAPAINSGRIALYNDPFQNEFPLLDIGSFRGANFNFGYVVLLKKINKQLRYIVSSPYGEHGKGMIVMRNNLYKPKTYKKIKYTTFTDTSGVGHLFGGSMCFLLYKNNEYLLVGSPTYSPMNSRKFDLGKVDVYANYDTNKTKIIATVSGEEDGGHFGHAMIVIGDINGDQIDDVAISAPFEDSYRGAIYIYSGATLMMSNGRNTWLQKIKPENNRFFGLSMTVLKNFDSNGCSALGVGSPKSNSVLVMHCFVSVVLQVYVPSTNMKLKKDDNGTHYTFESCVNIKYPPTHLKTTLDMNIEVMAVHPQVILDGDSWNYKLSISDNRTTYCNEIKLTVLKDLDLGIPVETNITASQVNSPTLQQEYDPSSVVLSDLSVLTTNDKLWIVHCNRSECVSNLQVSLNTSFMDEYLIGSTKEELISISVKNTGDPAYKACAFVQVSGVQVKLAPECERSPFSDTWMCPTKGPVWTDDVWKIKSIILEMDSLTSADNFIEITSYVSENCKESSSQSITRNKFTLKRDVQGVQIKGTSSFNDVVNITIGYEKILEHTYLITNNGSTNWVDVQYRLELPRMEFVTSDTDVKNLVLVDESTSCSLDENLKDNITVTCSIPNLKKNTVAKVVALIKASSLFISKERRKKTDFHTEFSLKVGETIRKLSLSNSVKYLKVAVDVIVFAVLFSLVLLGIIAFILYKIGFLKRKNKEKLIKLQKDVRRRTMLRQSLAASVNENADQDQILRELEFIEELSRDSTNK